MGGARVHDLERLRELMTPERARWVRELRTEQDYSYRALAKACAEAWDTDWGSNQYAGAEICFYAAEVLGDAYPDEWGDGEPA